MQIQILGECIHENFKKSTLNSLIEKLVYIKSEVIVNTKLSTKFKTLYLLSFNALLFKIIISLDRFIGTL